MRSGVITVVLVLLATVGLAAPATAEVAARGSTSAHWLGEFGGTQIVDDGNPPRSLTIVVTQNDTGPRVTMFPLDGYDVTDKVCSGDVVTSMSGVVGFYHPGFGWVHFADFELTRTA